LRHVPVKRPRLYGALFLRAIPKRHPNKSRVGSRSWSFPEAILRKVSQRRKVRKAQQFRRGCNAIQSASAKLCVLGVLARNRGSCGISGKDHEVALFWSLRPCPSAVSRVNTVLGQGRNLVGIVPSRKSLRCRC